MNLRKIDELVAEQVMNLKATSKNHDGESGHWDRADFTPLERYSSDIAAAWLVVEKMRSDGFLFSIGMADKWDVEFSLNDGRFLGKGDTEGLAYNIESAPLAICLAALRAKGISVE